MSHTRLLFCLCVAALGSSATAGAQQLYGSVRGTVSQLSGTPVVGAQVTLLGTAFGAVTDSRGTFQIEDVPAGRYVIRALATDSTPERALQIIAGTVTRIDLLLGAGERLPAPPAMPPSVSRDPVSGRLRVPGELLERLPIDEPRQTLTLLPGVVLRGDDIGVGSASLLSVRGSPPGEASVYVDGAPARFQTLGTQGIAIGANAIAEMGLTPGVADVEAGDASGGVLSYVTRSGGQRFRADFRAGTDGPFGAGSSVGYNRLEASLGGPVPGLARLTWFAAATLRGQSSPYLGLGAADQPTYVLGGADTSVQWLDFQGQPFSATLPQFVQYSGQCTSGQNFGFDCQGLRRPYDWVTERTGHGKVSFSYGAGSSVSLTGLASDLQRRFDPGAAIGDPALYAGSRAWSRLAVLNWAQRLPPAGAGSLVLKANLSVGSDGQLSGPLAPASEIATRDPTLGIEFRTLHFTGADSIPFPLTDAYIRDVRSNTGLRVPFLGRTDLRNLQSYRLNPYGLAVGWPTQGIDARLTMTRERRLAGRVAIEWLRGDHRVSLGLDRTSTRLSFYDGELIDEASLNVALSHPGRWGAFVADRWTRGGLDVAAGLRLDRFDPDGWFPRFPGRVFTDPSWDASAGTDDSAYARSVAAVFQRASPQRVVSPRLQVAYRVNAATSVRAAYGTAVLEPPFDRLLANANSDLAFTPATALYGRPITYPRQTTIEVGLRRLLVGKVWMDLSVYSQGVYQFVGRLQPFADPANPGRTLDINVLTPLDLGRGTGVDALVDWSPAPAARLEIAYGWLRAPLDDTGAPGVTTQTLAGLAMLQAPSTWAPGSVWGRLSRGVTASLAVRAVSGLPYTRLQNVGAGTLAPETGGGTPVGELNASRLSWTRILDLRIDKTVRLGRASGTIYLDLRNLLGFTNTLGAYAETGSTTNDQYRQSLLAGEFTSLRNESVSNGALLSGGDVDLRACATWSIPIDCIALQRVEQRFGDGDGVYTQAEQTRALNAYYDAFFGPWRFLGAGRTLRMGIQWAF